MPRWLIKIGILWPLALSTMLSCASFKETAAEAARAALAEAIPALKEAGKEVATHAAEAAKDAAGEFLAAAKDDLGGAIGQIPDLAATAGKKAAAEALAARAESDPDLAPHADEFRERAKENPWEALLWLAGASGLSVAGVIWRLIRAMAALRTVVQGVENAPADASAAVKAAVAAHGGRNPAVDAAIQAALK